MLMRKAAFTGGLFVFQSFGELSRNLICWRRLALEFQQVAGLALQNFAQLFQRAKADGFGSARFEHRKVLRRGGS